MNTWWRILNVLIGAWLFVSASLWMHSTAQSINTRWLGIAMIMVSGIAAIVPNARYGLMLSALWLWISLFVLPTWSMVTTWNGIIVAVLTFAVASLGPRAEEES
jgi:hypothetical protein